MEYSEEWKSLFPISSTHAPPLLLLPQPNPTPTIGPLFFNPIPQSLTPLLTSPPSLSPPFLTPPPHLSLPRFLETTASILPSTSSSISSSFSFSSLHDTISHSRLEPLPCPNNNTLLVFFPTGPNLDRVAFLVFSVHNSSFSLLDCNTNPVFTSNVKFDHRIVKLCACPVNDHDDDDFVGFLMANTLYAVHWFSVKVVANGDGKGKASLVYLGSKLFKSCGVGHACWSPHLPWECIVLLENGSLFLFDMNSTCSSARFRGKRISIPWDEVGCGGGGLGGWFSCEFSWHPRVFVIVSKDAVFLVDCRVEKCRASCLLKVEMLGVNDVVEDDRFVALSRAGSDGFLFTVASEHWLVLCDVRRPLVPVLRWAHNLNQPRYMAVFPLSELRARPRDENFVGCSELGFAVILGSFWNNEFSVFCFGCLPPGAKKSCFAKISDFSNSFYAWGLPSHLSLCEKNCLCGDCVLREEFEKDDLPEWIEWQLKKELVLGFFILNKDLSSLLPQSGEHGGFTIVRLMSSGKLEMQQYCASWQLEKNMSKAHQETRLHEKDALLCSMGDEKYKFPRRFKYLKLEYLYAHLSDDLAKLLFSKFRDAPANASGRESTNERIVDFMCEKFEPYGCNPPITHLSASDVFRDVDMPTSLYEIVCKVMWIRLPMDILEMAFSDYAELLGLLIDSKKVSLDFPVIPHKSQSPPFVLRNPSHRSNKWPSQERPSDDFVGPVVPLPASMVLSEIKKHGISFIGKVNEFSLKEAFGLQCKSVMCLAKEIGIRNSRDEEDKQYAVSLVNDKEETWFGSQNPNPFFLYEPSAFSNELPYLDVSEDPYDFVQEGERYNIMIAKLPENGRDDKVADEDVLKLFDDLCPVELQLDDHEQMFSDNELKAFELLKTQFSQWQDGFLPYKNLCTRLRPQ